MLYNDQSKSVLSFKTISNFLKSIAYEVNVETKKEMKNVPIGMIIISHTIQAFVFVFPFWYNLDHTREEKRVLYVHVNVERGNHEYMFKFNS